MGADLPAPGYDYSMHFKLQRSNLGSRRFVWMLYLHLESNASASSHTSFPICYSLASELKTYFKAAAPSFAVYDFGASE